jgi:hypothetical protein
MVPEDCAGAPVQLYRIAPIAKWTLFITLADTFDCYDRFPFCFFASTLFPERFAARPAVERIAEGLIETQGPGDDQFFVSSSPR